MNHELDNLLTINEMYKEQIRDLEKVIDGKDDVIKTHLKSISKLTEGSKKDLQELKLLFFAEKQNLASSITEQRDQTERMHGKFNWEIKIK